MIVVRNDKNELISQCTITGWWMCIDYRNLNKATKKDHFLLPFIDEMLERLAKHSFFVFFMGILDIIKSWSTLTTKVRPLSHARMELTHTDECRSDYVMLQLLSNSAWCLFSLSWSRKSWRCSWMTLLSMEKPSMSV
jgi:hypothetical protein